MRNMLISIPCSSTAHRACFYCNFLGTKCILAKLYLSSCSKEDIVIADVIKELCMQRDDVVEYMFSEEEVEVSLSYTCTMLTGPQIVIRN